MRIGEALSKSKSLRVEFSGGGLINVVYDATIVTPEWLDRDESENNRNAMVEQILEMVKSWDLEEDDSTEEKKKIIPIIRDRLQKVPMPILSQVMRTILDDLFPNRTRSVRSGSFS